MSWMVSSLVLVMARLMTSLVSWAVLSSRELRRLRVERHVAFLDRRWSNWDCESVLVRIHLHDSLRWFAVESEFHLQTPVDGPVAVRERKSVPTSGAITRCSHSPAPETLTSFLHYQVYLLLLRSNCPCFFCELE